MSQSILQLNYDEIQQISNTLRNESDEILQLHNATRGKMEALCKDWVGRAANGFFNEMESSVLPATLRVSKALETSNIVLNDIAKIIQAADQETAGYFGGLGALFMDSTIIGTFPIAPPIGWLQGIKGEVFGGISGYLGDDTTSLGVSAKFGWDGQAHDGGWYQVARWDTGAKIGFGEDGFTAGAYGEFELFSTEKSQVFGSSVFGFTTTEKVSAGSVEGFIGIKDNKIGAEVGAYIASAEGYRGINIAGYNISIGAGIGLGWAKGFTWGPEETKVKFGPFKIGLRIGKAIT